MSYGVRIKHGEEKFWLKTDEGIIAEFYDTDAVREQVEELEDKYDMVKGMSFSNAQFYDIDDPEPESKADKIFVNGVMILAFVAFVMGSFLLVVG